MAESTRRPDPNAPMTLGRGDSRHSHFEYGSTRGQWHRDDGTDFAITSVNVPDRLDTQEVRNRADSEARQPSVGRFHREDVLRAIRWGSALAVVALGGWLVFRQIAPLRAALSPAGVERHLGAALGVPVSVAGTAIRFTPSPRLVVSDLVAQSGYRLPEISVHFNWSDVLRGVQTSTWALGEARVAPVAVSGDQALALLQSVGAAANLSAAVTSIRFESISFSDVPLMPGRYEAVIRRVSGQQPFALVNLRQLDSGDAKLELEIRPPTVQGGSAEFALFATRWRVPVGPAMQWSEATAQGAFRQDSLRVDAFSVGARFGNLNGTAALNRSGHEWQLTGKARSPDLNVGELIRSATGLGEGERSDERLPLRGVAKIELTLAGSGATVQEALRRATASGSGTLPGAIFTGLNLGLAATQGDTRTAGGATRLTDLDFDVIASSDGLNIRNLSGRAGSLRLSGGFAVGGGLQLSGSIRPEVSSPRGVATQLIQLGGTIAAPTYR